MKRIIIIVTLCLLSLGAARAEDEPVRDQGQFAVFHGFTTNGAWVLVSLHNRQSGLIALRYLATDDGQIVREILPAELKDKFGVEPAQPGQVQLLPDELAKLFVQPGVQSPVSPAGLAATFARIEHDKPRDVRSAYGFTLAQLKITYWLQNAGGPTKLASFELGTCARAEQPVEKTRTHWTPDGMRYVIVGRLSGADPAPGLSVSQAVILTGRVGPPHRKLDWSKLGKELNELGESYYKQRLYWDAAYHFARAAAMQPDDPEPRFMAARCYALLGERRQCIRQIKTMSNIHNKKTLKLLLSIKRQDDFELLRRDPTFLPEIGRLIDAFPR